MHAVISLVSHCETQSGWQEKEREGGFNRSYGDGGLREERKAGIIIDKSEIVFVIARRRSIVSGMRCGNKTWLSSLTRNS